MTKKIEPTIQGKALDDLVNQCLIVTDRRGRVLGKHHTTVTSFLSMEYQSDYGKITFAVYSSAMGNGSYKLTVTEGRTILFEASGNYTACPFNSKAEIYNPGDWEKKLENEWRRVKS